MTCIPPPSPAPTATHTRSPALVRHARTLVAFPRIWCTTKGQGRFFRFALQSHPVPRCRTQDQWYAVGREPIASMLAVIVVLLLINVLLQLLGLSHTRIVWRGGGPVGRRGRVSLGTRPLPPAQALSKLRDSTCYFRNFLDFVGK